MIDLRHNHAKRVEEERRERDKTAVPALVKAALALGGTPRETCGKVMLGQGTDTWDPLCQRGAGHDGECKASGRP